MLRQGSLVALSALALSLAACGFDVRKGAAKDIATFLGAVQREDAKAMEAALDRPALRADLRNQLAALGRTKGIDIGAGPSEFAMDRMITAQAIRRAESHTGLPPAPTADQIAPLLKAADKAHVCVQDAARTGCALSFALRKGVWRLVGMPATDANGP